MTSAQIAATSPLIAVLVYFALKSSCEAISKWWKDRKLTSKS
jgi:hypothetical protein